MTLEDFKDVYQDKAPIEKLRLMAIQFDLLRQDAVNRKDANWRGNYDEVAHYNNECEAKRARIEWLMEEINKALKEHDPQVMHVNDVTACEVGTVLWVEERQGVTWNLFPLEIETNSMHPDTGTAYLFFIAYHGLKKFECDDYGHVWRCWTDRPSEDVRKAVKWDA